ncbi:uncharacterized protein F5Z01DRAFT_633469 [Emericellopsis atlantica]|uniref:Pentatricopeptide repeat domain-containing protein n=1 Tax=Emericellopsis atlantica TaxID=2614577 RepID=A0A9P8CS80_9HYPO|nr:uncharacterized protein F5Z01DRAFT_633469 [Emericellopsis atlantica]KAG9257533.1 hypothetical protein F5Z01DRAFT_633469 [Emericellopsis atlantica]
MKTLWQRAKQAHSCGCRACSTVARGASKRVTTPRRKATFVEIFTAAYSSVFASAAIVDSIRKDERRRDLDRQLEEARRDLAALREQGSGRGAEDADNMSAQSSISLLTDEQMHAIWQAMKGIWKTGASASHLQPAEAQRHRHLVHVYLNGRGLPIASRSANTSERLELALLAEESEHASSARDPEEPVHMQKFGESIGFLVERLLRQVESEDAPSPSFDEATSVLRTSHHRYGYRSSNPAAAAANLKALNKANQTAINDSNAGIKEKVGRVCYNLLVSVFPPDMNIFNTLIAGFDKHPATRKLSGQMVDFFFTKSLLKPTPCTFAAILHHYSVTGQHEQFFRTMACICGSDATTGAKLMRRKVKDLRKSRELQAWAADEQKRSMHSGYVWQHASLNMIVIEEMLSGLLRLGSFDKAMEILTVALQAGVRIASRIVKQTLDECLEALDWRAGWELTHQLARHERMWPFLMTDRDQETAAYIIDRVVSLMAVVGAGTRGVTLADSELGQIGLSRSQLARLWRQLSKTNASLPNPAQLPRLGTANGKTRVARRTRRLQFLSADAEVTRINNALIGRRSKNTQMSKISVSYRRRLVLHRGEDLMREAQFWQKQVEEALEQFGSLRLGTVADVEADKPLSVVHKVKTPPVDGRALGEGYRGLPRKGVAAAHYEDSFPWALIASRRGATGVQQKSTTW